MTKRRTVGAPAVAAGLFLIVLAATAVGAAFFDPDGPVTGALLRAREGPSADHWLGTDHLGRDELSRLLAGARISLFAAVEAVGIAVLVGVPLGLVAGYWGGWWDRCATRLTEIVLCIPAVIVAIALVGSVGPGVGISMLAVGFVFAARMLRLVRGEVISAWEAAYVDAARVSGSGDARIVWHHLLPNLLPTILVQATVMFAGAVLAEATLSFLGLGVVPPGASLGVMLDQARDHLDRAPLLAVWPGIAIFLAVLAFNILGDGLRKRYGTPDAPGALSASPIARVGAAGPARTQGGAVLAVRNLTVSVPRSAELTEVVSDVSFEVAAGEVVGLVGESGCGKSTTALAVLGLVPAPGRVEADSITVVGTEVVGFTFDDFRRVRGRHVGLVAQEPWASLNPVYPILRQVAEPLRWHFDLSRREAARGATAMLERVGIGSARRVCYPHELSGGEAQRVALAMALVAEPEVLIADEPTTALDAVVQRDILDLIQALRREREFGVLLISHDIAVVSAIADRVAVMYAGELVETASTHQALFHPRHPYTAGLIDAVPRNESRRADLRGIPGRMPVPGEWPTGCRYADRCSYKESACALPVPLVGDGPTGAVRCVRNGTLRLEGVKSISEGELDVRPYVSVRDLSVTFRRRSAFGSRRTVEVRAVDGVDLEIFAGETVGLVGGSGSGKTTTGKAILHLVPAVHGTITVGDFEVSNFERAAPRGFRREAQMVFQNIVASLNPAFTVAEIVGDPLRAQFRLRGAAQRSRVLELLEQVGLEPRHADVYRHELSVGQRQRVCLARALATEPCLIVLDESVSALDGSSQAGIIALLEQLQREHGIAYLFITHDLAIARHVSHRIAVMCDGRIVETGSAEQISKQAEHPYTRRLVESFLGLDR